MATNKSAAAAQPTSLEPGEGDWKVLADSLAGKGAETGLQVSYVNANTVRVAPGVAVIGGTRGAISVAIDLTVTTAISNPRIDLIVVDLVTGGPTTALVIPGVEAPVSGSSRPGWPSVSPTQVVVARVWSQPGVGITPEDVVDKRALIVNQRTSVLSPATGVKGDGTTNDGPAFEAIFSMGGDWWIPSTTGGYLMGGRTSNGNHIPSATVRARRSLSVECAPGAVILAGIDLAHHMFDFGTNSAGLLIQFSWRGGVVDCHQQAKSFTVPHGDPTLNPTADDYVRIDLPGRAKNVFDHQVNIANSFHFSPANWSALTIDDTIFSSNYFGSAVDPKNLSFTHWQSAGGDTHVFVDEVVGDVRIRNTTHLGASDLGIYIRTVTAADSPASFLVQGCSGYSCWGLVSLKGDIANFRVADCYTFNCPDPYSTNRPSYGGHPSNGVFTSCVAEQYHVAFSVRDSTGISLSGIRGDRAGALGRDGLPYSAGHLSSSPTCVRIVRSRNISVDGAYFVGGVIPTKRPLVLWLESSNEEILPSAPVPALSLSSDIKLRNFHVDEVLGLGGDKLIANVESPQRVSLVGLTTGEQMGSFGGPTRLGHDWVFDPGHAYRRVTSVITSSTNATSTLEPAGFATTVYAGRAYDVRVRGVWQGDVSDDLRIFWTLPTVPSGGTAHVGHWAGFTQKTSATATSSVFDRQAMLWTTNQFQYGLTGDPELIELEGTLIAGVTGVLRFGWRKQANTSSVAASLHPGAVFEVRWVG
jgi:hypothetical protein